MPSSGGLLVRVAGAALLRADLERVSVVTGGSLDRWKLVAEGGRRWAISTRRG
jgi:hypothetical protein